MIFHILKKRKDLKEKTFDTRVNNYPSWNEEKELEGILEKQIKEYLQINL